MNGSVSVMHGDEQGWPARPRTAATLDGMSWYAATSWRTIRQVTSDVFVLVWVVGWWLVSRAARRAVAAIAGPAERTSGAAQKIADDFRSAAESVGSVPGAGSSLRAPFDRAADSMLTVVASANDQVTAIGRLADLVGVLTVAIPVLIVVAWWLPVRLRFLVNARASRRYIDATADLDLFALRAMATQPMPVLAAISDDPVRAWRDGDRSVITALADVELRRAGLRLPEQLRDPAAAEPTAGDPIG